MYRGEGVEADILETFRLSLEKLEQELHQNVWIEVLNAILLMCENVLANKPLTPPGMDIPALESIYNFFNDRALQCADIVPRLIYLVQFYTERIYVKRPRCSTPYF